MSIAIHKIRTSDVGAWEAGLDALPLVLNVPAGLEGACAGIARRESGLRLKALGPGLLHAQRTPQDQAVQALRRAPIWSFGSFVLLATLDQSGVASGAALSAAENAIDAAASRFELIDAPYWLNCPAREPESARRLAAQILASTRIPLRNQPSDYRLTLRLAAAEGSIRLLLGPSISVKERFAYRRADVGASINPVLAAVLVRLVPPVEGGLVVDPTCGSGTLLAERLAFSNEDVALGIDVSKRAEQAFRQNLLEGPAADRFSFRLGDSADLAHWCACRAVVANLPFGIRVRQPHGDLARLYNGILENAARSLEPDGRVVITSSFKSLLDRSFSRIQGDLRILSRYRAEMGGLFYQVVVAAKS